MVQVIEKGNQSASVYRSADSVFKACNNQVKLLKSKDPYDPEIERLERMMDDLNHYATTYHPRGKDNWLVRYTFQAAMNVIIPTDDGVFLDSKTEERKVYTTIDMFDRATSTLYLIKLCKTTDATKGPLRTNWEREGSMQAWIMENNSIPVHRLVALCIYKNWEKGVAENEKRQSAYPKQQISEIELSLMPMEDVEKEMQEFLLPHIEADAGGDIMCSEKQRWKTTDSFMIVNPTAKLKPILKKDLHSQEEAALWMKNNYMISSNAQIEMQPGVNRRCMDYCPVRDVCKQWAQEKKIMESWKMPQKALPKHVEDSGSFRMEA
jgi:hypothetical protein